MILKKKHKKLKLYLIQITRKYLNGSIIWSVFIQFIKGILFIL